MNSNQSDVSNLKPEKLAAKDLNRTESTCMSSTCSTLSLFSHLPSRNPSFSVYDGGESSPYSHESLEIGDSVENLQVSEWCQIQTSCLIVHDIYIYMYMYVHYLLITIP